MGSLYTAHGQHVQDHAAHAAKIVCEIADATAYDLLDTSPYKRDTGFGPDESEGLLHEGDFSVIRPAGNRVLIVARLGGRYYLWTGARRFFQKLIKEGS